MGQRSQERVLCGAVCGGVAMCRARRIVRRCDARRARWAVPDGNGKEGFSISCVLICPLVRRGGSASLAAGWRTDPRPAPSAQRGGARHRQRRPERREPGRLQEPEGSFRQLTRGPLSLKKRTAFGLSALVCRETRAALTTGRKIVAKETQEGCLSRSINRFSELLEVLENAGSLSKRHFRQAEADSPLGCPLFCLRRRGDRKRAGPGVREVTPEVCSDLGKWLMLKEGRSGGINGRRRSGPPPF